MHILKSRKSRNSEICWIRLFSQRRVVPPLCRAHLFCLSHDFRSCVRPIAGVYGCMDHMVRVAEGWGGTVLPPSALGSQVQACEPPVPLVCEALCFGSSRGFYVMPGVLRGMCSAVHGHLFPVILSCATWRRASGAPTHDHPHRSTPTQPASTPASHAASFPPTRAARIYDAGEPPPSSARLRAPVRPSTHLRSLLPMAVRLRARPVSSSVACREDEAAVVNDPVLADWSAPSNEGSVGHPFLCSRPCLFVTSGSCASGNDCAFCHRSHPKRPLHLDKRNREMLDRMPDDARTALLLSLLQEKAAPDQKPGGWAGMATFAWPFVDQGSLGDFAFFAVQPCSQPCS